VFTSALGDNANSGKSADAPMASLSALLKAYDLDAGDVIYVDSGTYGLSRNIVLEAQDSGVRIVGAGTGKTIFDRGNVASFARVIDLAGADAVTIEAMTLRGGYHAIYAAGGWDSDGVTIRGTEIVTNENAGLVVEASNEGWRIEGNTVHANKYRGIGVSEGPAVIVGNEVYGNASTGIYVTESTAGAAFTIVVEGNLVHDNADNGVEVNGNAVARGNTVYNHLTGSRYGLTAASGASVVDNRVYGNRIGMNVTSGAIAEGNAVYANVQAGVQSDGATVRGNRIYSNPIGIDGIHGSLIENNVIYANTNTGIRAAYPFSGDGTVINNTIYQPVGDAVRFEQNAQNYRFFNNIFVVEAGNVFNVTVSSTTGFQSDFNLFDTSGVNARLGVWAGAQRNELADWRVATGQDAGSDEGLPLFLDSNGADDVLGDTVSSLGTGNDDNFGLRRGSPAIDAANAYVAPRFDIEGRDRQRDPGTPDTGTGWPLYVAADAGASNVAPRATEGAATARSTNTWVTENIGFAFSFYGQTYTQLTINSNGYLNFGNNSAAQQNDNSLDVLAGNVRIAPLWDDLNTSGTGKGVFIDRGTPGEIRIRWAAVREGTTTEVNFAATLYANGSIRFDYGAGNSGLTPTVGVSSGNGYSFVLATGYNDTADLASRNALLWQPTPGLTFYDVGAYEFQGNSGDATAPQVVAISNLPAPGGSTGRAFSSVAVTFSEALDGVAARSAANYELLSAGADGAFGTPDDLRLSLGPVYTFPETDLTLQFGGGILAEGRYRLSISPQSGLFDTSGNALAPYVHEFRIDRTANVAPVATDAAVDLNEDGSVLITLAAVDGNGDPLTFALVNNPLHGTLSGFDPVTRQVTYTPNADFNGTDSFRFRVDDGQLGTDEGTITLRIAPVNDAPAAGNATITTREDEAVNIALPGSDVETPRAQLLFELVDAPDHGTLSQGTGGVWTYTPDPDYTGADSFTYRVRDRGDPNGDTASALSSAVGTIDLNVVASNDAPVIAPIGALSAEEGSAFSFALAASDADGDALTYTLLSGPAGAAVDSATGLLTWTPADGPAAAGFSVRVSDGRLFTDASFEVQVLNVAPAIQLSGPATTLINTPVTIEFSAADPGADTRTAWIVNWGDGRSNVLAANATQASTSYGLGGSFVITVTAVDEDGSHVSQGHNLQVTQPNRAPTAIAQSVALDEDGSLTITLGGSDPDGDTLTFEIVDATSPGTLSAIDPVTRRVVYTPAADFHGSDSFTFRVGDGTLSSTPATVSITVRPVNDAPVLGTVGDLSVLEDAAVAFDLAVSDADQAAGFTYQVVSGPAGAQIDAGGRFTWQAPDLAPGAPLGFTLRVTDAAGAFDEESFEISVQPDYLKVVSASATADGVAVRFNRALDAGKLNLYASAAYPLGAADLTLRATPSSTPLAGSIVLDADHKGFHFIKTGAPPVLGSYTLTLASRADGFTDQFGRLLDGNGDGVTGDSWTSTLTLGRSPAEAVVSLPDFMRGPGQALAQPQAAAALPVRITSVTAFSSVSFEVAFDPLSLDLDAVVAVAGSTLQADLSAPGLARITVTFAAPVSGTGVEIARLTGSVPATAEYGAKRVLSIRNVVLDGVRAGRGDDALQVVGFSGDATRDASTTTLDLQRLQRVIAKQDSGFGEWSLVDPAVIGDVSGNAQFNSADATLLLREISGSDRPEIPPIPAGTTPLEFSGADPLVSLPSTLSARAGERFTVPVNLDTAAGLESVQLRLTWDAAALQLLDVQRGSLTGGFQWFIQKSEPGQLVIDASALQALTGGSGSLVQLDFQLSEQARPGVQLVDLQWARLNDSHLTLNPAPRVGADPTDMLVRVVQPASAPAGGQQARPLAIAAGLAASAARAQPVDKAPLIDWAAANRMLLSAKLGFVSGTSEWLADFVNELGKDESERKPNSRLRIPALRR
jgi:hypothetical protein